MKTFLVVTFYTIMVAALDLGGAVWTSFRSAHPVKAAVVSVVPAAPQAKTVNAGPVSAPIPSGT